MTIPTVARPKPVQLNDVRVYVVNEEIYEEFVKEFTSEDAWGPGGYLEERGLIPMPDIERQKFAIDGANLNPLTKR